MRILMIEDDKAYAKSIQLALKLEGLEVETAADGEGGLDLGSVYQYSAILLDLGLPDINGHQVLKDLRNQKVQCPVIILSGNDQIDEQLKALGFGADLFLTKAISPKVLAAQIKALVRRSHGHSDKSVKVGRLSVDLDARLAYVDETVIGLTTKEFAMLELLALRKGNTLSKEAFVNHLYNGMDEPDPKIVDVFICRLRKKMADLSDGDNFIETVWGRGYMLRDPANAEPSKKKVSVKG